MRSLTLTGHSETVDGRLTHAYEWEGHAIPVCDSMANMLLVIELFGDESLAPGEKQGLLLRMLFPESRLAEVVEVGGDGLSDLVAAVLWDACGLDVVGDRPHERAAFDWTQDAARIEASVMAEYHMTWDEFAGGRSFADACDLLAAMLEGQNQTSFRQALAYRLGRPPKRTKYNGEYVDAWMAMRRHFALDERESEPADRMRSENDVARDFFSALRAKAESRRDGRR